MLRRVRGEMGLSIPDLAGRLGVDKNTLGSYEREERALPSPEFLAKFSKVTGAPLDELIEARLESSEQAAQLGAALSRLRGASSAVLEFAMRRSGISKEQAADLQLAAHERGLDVDGLEREFGVRHPLNIARQDTAGYAYIPLYDVQVAAGGGRMGGGYAVNELAFREEWIRSTLHVNPGDLSLVHVEGDSMEPDLRAGDIILIDHTDTTVRREGIYVVRMDDALLVKQVQRLPGDVFKLMSRNTVYEPINIPVSAVQEGGKYSIIGRVVWACRRL